MIYHISIAFSEYSHNKWATQCGAAHMLWEKLLYTTNTRYPFTFKKGWKKNLKRKWKVHVCLNVNDICDNLIINLI